MRTLDVVVGAVLDKGKFLAEKRKANERIDPRIVCLLGGHVESNETGGNALIREMREESSIEFKKPRFIKRSSWVANNGERQNGYYYLILDYEGEPSCRAEEELLWIENVDELDVKIDRQAVEEGRTMSKRAEAW